MAIQRHGLRQDFDALTTPLLKDIQQFERLIAQEDSGTWRRGYCHAVFAFIEATTEWMKRSTIDNYYPETLGDDEKRLLESRNGILAGLFGAFDLYADTAGARTPLQKGGIEWIALERAIKIRNRITHPKFPKDIQIFDADLSHIRLAKGVLISLAVRCFLDSGTALFRQGEAWMQIAKKRAAAELQQS